MHSQWVNINLTVLTGFFSSKLILKKSQSLCLHFFKSFILRLLPLAVWITYQQLRIFHKVLACSHPAVLTVTDCDEKNLKGTARQCWTGSAHCLSAAYRAVDALWPAVNHVWKFPVIPEIWTPLIQVNNKAYAAQTEENTFEFELKKYFVLAQIFTLS